jgi:hypothetical protein
MLGAWPEPFGLVAIESMATGTPVIARRAGALTETIEHGVSGFLVDDATEAALAIRFAAGLDRAQVRRSAIERFSPARMADEYEAAYLRVLGLDRPALGEDVPPVTRSRTLERGSSSRCRPSWRAGRPKPSATARPRSGAGPV